jgi:ferredoxin-NADP reductase
MAEKVARLTSLQEIAPNVIVLDATMVEPPAIDYRAGQFVSVRIDDQGDVRRSYTMTSSPSRNDGFELLVKLVPGGAASAHFGRLKVGDELHFTGPMGFFTLEALHPGDHVLVATGAGIAAALPMAQAVSPPRRARLLWSMRREDEFYWLDRLAPLAWEKVVPPMGEWHEAHTLLADRCAALLSELDDPLFYLVGNGDMTRVVRDRLLGLGVDRRQRIRNEIFYPVAEP